MTAPKTSEQPGPPDNRSGFGRGSYASPAQTSAYEAALDAWLGSVNARWLDTLTDVCGGPPPVVRELGRLDVNGHLLDWACRTGRLDKAILVEHVKAGQFYRYVAVVYHRSPSDRGALGREAVRRAAAYWRGQVAALCRERPEFGDAVAERFGEVELTEVEDGDVPDEAYRGGRRKS